MSKDPIPVGSIYCIIKTAKLELYDILNVNVVQGIVDLSPTLTSFSFCIILNQKWRVLACKIHVNSGERVFMKTVR